MGKVTIYDVAREAQCSTATVSLVLQNSDKIKASTQQRVMEAVDKLGYSPNFAARCLSSKYTNLLGLIVPNLENPLFAHMVKGVEAYANSRGYGLILGVSALSLDKEMFYMQMLSERRVDGLLVFPTFLDEIFTRFMQKEANQSVPLVLCGSSGVKDYPVSYVKCDNRMGAYMATDHLVSVGRRRIACLCAVADQRQAQSRIMGYRDALLFHGMEPEPGLIRYCSQEWEDIYSAAVKLLREEKVDAIFCLYDYMSIAVMRAAENLGLCIPDDVAIIGYDNIQVSQFLPISLSTIDTHSTRVGSMATELLIERIQNPDTPCRQIQLKPDLIVRESTMGKRQHVSPGAE